MQIRVENLETVVDRSSDIERWQAELPTERIATVEHLILLSSEMKNSSKKLNSGYRSLLELFNQHEVEYLVDGAFAFCIHALPRCTRDIDIWVNPTDANAQKVFKSLTEFDAMVHEHGVTSDTFAQEGVSWQQGEVPVNIDIFTSTQGVLFPDAWKNKTTIDLDGTEIHFISLEDLIMVKRIYNRHFDRVDVETLELARSMKHKQSS